MLLRFYLSKSSLKGKSACLWGASERHGASFGFTGEKF